MDSFDSNSIRLQHLLAEKKKNWLISDCLMLMTNTKTRNNGFLPLYADFELNEMIEQALAEHEDRKRARESELEAERNRASLPPEMESSSDRYLLDRLNKLEAIVKELQEHVEEADIFTTSNK